ncbi:MAG TPA: hypothetical protein VK973_12080 [Arenicellales bacterium]|nr:hypothetical protein [Arenicellales bacterium]
MIVMGILDAPAPLLAWIDAQLAGLAPPAARIAAWGVLGGVVSMLAYRALSPQERIARGKSAIAVARRELDVYDGDFAGAWPLIRRLLGLSLAQVARSGWPAVVASLPLLCLLVWLSNAYGHRFPAAGAAPEIHTQPPRYQTQWRQSDHGGEPPRIAVLDGNGRMVAKVALEKPVAVVHKRRWWNALVASPADYLPADGALDSLRIELPRREYLPFGYDWLRGWETVFFAFLLATSIAMKVGLRIE